MKALIQRVQCASVSIAGQQISAIERGCLVFLGIHVNDQESVIRYLAKKIAHLRIFPDQQGKMHRSLIDVDGQILLVSQFTLYGICAYGNRPSFVEAASPQIALPLYENFLQELANYIKPSNIQAGRFGADMQVQLVNDGPVTLLLERFA